MDSFDLKTILSSYFRHNRGLNFLDEIKNLLLYRQFFEFISQTLGHRLFPVSVLTLGTK